MPKKSEIYTLPDAGAVLTDILDFYLACCRGEKVSIKTSAGEIMSPALAKERIAEARLDERQKLYRKRPPDKKTSAL